jgi:choline/glycine/proline betaine transport protein
MVECILGRSDWFIDLAMLMANGITALQNATIIMGLPFSFVMFLVMAGLYKSLRLRRSASQ